MAGTAALRRAVLAAALVWCGCAESSGGPAAYCKLGAEHEVARTTAKDFDAIELVAAWDGALALWSTAHGLFGQLLDAQGERRGSPQRLGVRCAGGLDAELDGDAIELACLLHPERSGKHGDEGGVLLHRVDRGLRVMRTRRVGSSGPDSEGVALARGPSGLELAWHDGAADAQRVLWLRLDEEGATPRAVSDAGRSAKAPTLVAISGHTFLAWAETFIESGALGSRIALWEPEGITRSTRTLLAGAHVAAMPQLFPLHGEMALGYRERKGGEKTGLNLMSFAAPGATTGDDDAAQLRALHAIRVGRADGVGRPALAACMDGVVAATPRTYGGDYFVGVNWLDRGLSRTRGEQQFYEDSHAFTQVSAACLGAHALLLIAEFPQLHVASSALRAVPYRCR
jgi:hypothetical protein